MHKARHNFIYILFNVQYSVQECQIEIILTTVKNYEMQIFLYNKSSLGHGRSSVTSMYETAVLFGCNMQTPRFRGK